MVRREWKKYNRKPQRPKPPLIEVEWPDCINSLKLADSGYGYVYFEGRVRLAHRVAYAKAFGPIPDGLCVLHKCDNRRCVNVNHLFLGTRIENNKDRDMKGRRRDLNGEEHPIARLSWPIVRELRANPPENITVAALRLGVRRQTVSAVLRGLTWREVA